MVTSWLETTSSEGELRVLVTNMESFSIELQPCLVRYEDRAGTVFDTPRFLWNGQASVLSLPAMGVAKLDFQVPSDTRRVRVLLEYSRQAGLLRRGLSCCLSRLPLTQLAPRIYNWFRQRGFIDGVITKGYEGPWIVNPQMQRTEASQVGMDANSTATPAGSRR
jgi:hypothetical protein